MKRSALWFFVFVAAGSGLFSASAHAYKSAGCGLGSMIFKEDDFSQVFAFTTNGILFTQVFGITSGTSGCREVNGNTVALEQEVFISSNFENLSQDMARGSGEYVDAFGTLLGCPRAEFNQWSRQNFRNFKTEDARSLYDSVRTGITNHPSLAKSCDRLS